MVTGKNGTSKEIIHNEKSNGNYPKRIIMTAAQSSYYMDSEGVLRKWGGNGDLAILNENLYNGLKKIAGEEELGELRILPIQGLCCIENILHESVRDLPELFSWSRKFEKLNNNITQSDIRVPPQNVDPTTSRKHLVSKYRSSLVYPHSKQRFCPIPSHKSPLPRFLMTTGCVTSPNYNNNNDRGDQARRDHKLGAILIDIKSKTHYDVRFLTAQKNGKFVDLGYEYNGIKKPKKIGVEALVLGDIHYGEHDLDTEYKNSEMIEKFKPKNLVIHDVFTAKSISHWAWDKPINLAIMHAKGELSLENELSELHGSLKSLSKEMGKREIFIVSSNHDAFLPKYLNKRNWKNDPWNFGFASSLVGRIIHKGVPEDEYLKEALSYFGKIPKNVNFLRLNDKLSVQGYQLAVHGHLGKNGARGMSIKAVDETIGKGVIGHKHAPEQFRESYVVGTSSRLDLDYMKGSASAAMPGNLAIYSNGKAQLLPFIN